MIDYLARLIISKQYKTHIFSTSFFPWGLLQEGMEVFERVPTQLLFLHDFSSTLSLFIVFVTLLT